MPNVVVYVPAKAWKALEERGFDPAKTIREFAKRGYAVEGQLPEREDRVPGRASDRALSVSADSPKASEERVASVSSRSGSCPMSPPRGTKCKVCGKVHPL